MEEGISLVEVVSWYRNAGYRLYSDLLSKDMEDIGFRPCSTGECNFYRVEDISVTLLVRGFSLKVLERKLRKKD